MIYLFSDSVNMLESQPVIPSEIILEHEVTKELNGFNSVYIEYVAGEVDVSEAKYVVFMDSNNDFQMYKILSKGTKGTVSYIEGVHKFLDDLKASDFFIEFERTDVEPKVMLESALSNTQWVLDTSDTFPSGSISLGEVSPLEVLEEVLKKFPIEIDYWVEFDSNSIVSQRYALRESLGVLKNKFYEYGSNVLNIEVEHNTSEIYTAAIGLGATIENENKLPQEKEERVDFSNIVWSKSNGNPLDKPKGYNVLIDDQATIKHGYFENGKYKPRITYVVFDEIEDPNELIQETHKWLVFQTLPKAVYRVEVFDGDNVNLGDEVAVRYADIGVSKWTKVSMTKENLIAGKKDIYFGDVGYFNSNSTKGKLEGEIDTLKKSYKKYSQRIYEMKLAFDKEFVDRVNVIENEYQLRLDLVTNQIQADKEAFENEMSQMKLEQQQRVSEIYEDIGDINQTVSDVADKADYLDGVYTDLSTQTGQVSSTVANIIDGKAPAGSVLKQTIDGVVGRVWEQDIANIEVGDRNLLKDSGRYIKNSDYNIARYYLTEDLKENEEVTIQLKGRLAPDRSRFAIYNSGGLINPTSLYPSDIKAKRNLAINSELRDDYVSHSGDFARVQYDLAYNTETGKTYTVSFDIVGSLVQTDAVTVNNFISASNISQSFYAQLNGTRGVVTFTARHSGDKILIYKGKSGNTSENYDRTIYIKNVMVVEGAEEAPWSPAWEEEMPIFEKTFNWSNSRIYNGVVTAPVGQWVNIYQMNSSDTGESEIEWVKLVRGKQISGGYTPAPEDNLKYTDLVMKSDSFMLGSFELGGDKIAQAIVGKAGAIDLIADNVNLSNNLNVANQIKSLSLEAVYANISSLRTRMLVADVITANMVKFDTALIEKFTSSTAFINSLTAKSAFINTAKVTELISTDGRDSFTLAGGMMNWTRSTGQTLELDITGLYMKNSDGSIRYQIDRQMVTSAALGTSNSNVYLATDTGFEARIVDRNELPGNGLVGSYTYRPLRLLSLMFPPGLNAYFGTDGEFRFMSQGLIGSGVYRDIRAATSFVNRVETHQTDVLYLGGNTEVRTVSRGSASSHIPLRTVAVLFPTGLNAYYGADGEHRFMSQGLSSSGVYRDIRYANSYSQTGNYYGVNNNVLKVNSTYIQSQSFHDRTYSSSTNMVVTSNGIVGRATSARKYKLAIEHQFADWQEQLNHSKKILEVRPSTWFDRFESETYAEELTLGKRIDEEDFKVKRHFGAIADEFHELGLTELVQYNEDDEVEGLAYDRMSVHHNVLIKDLYDENDTLKTELKELKSQINKIMEMIA